MSNITLIGGLDDRPRRDDLVAALNQLSDKLKWDYVDADPDLYVPSKARFNPLIERLIAAKKTGQRHQVVKLHKLHQRTQGQLYAKCPDPNLVPKEVATSTALLAWLRTPDANLIPQREWFVNLQEAALIAILCKLISKKSWNKDTKGHHWTLEEHLLQEAPVLRHDFQDIHNEAVRMLPSLRDKLLLSKGANQGSTPKEWCIRIDLLSAVMRSMLGHSLDPLAAVDLLKPLMRQVRGDVDRRHRVDEGVLSEKIRELCRAQARGAVK
jgi:hypothetical protein